MSGSAPHLVLRRPFEGVSKILEYNWPQYLIGCAVAMTAVAAAAFVRMPTWATWILVGGASLAIWWLVSSLVASHWIYDRSSLYRWTWVPTVLRETPMRWVNIHAGLDESTEGLAAVLGQPPLVVLDIFDPTEMTEPSIARARNDARPTWPSVSCPGSVPVDVQNVNVIFAIFCLHEVRRDQRRIDVMADLASRLTTDGRIFVVEHLRDVANFVVFGGGFVHFLSRRVWFATFAAAALAVVGERRVTPFVRVFELQRLP